MSYVFTDFIGRIATQDHPEALRATMSRFVEGLGLEIFLFLKTDDATGEQCIISNYPGEWLEHYVRNDYAHVDPVVRRASHSKSSFLWGGEEYNSLLHGKQKVLFDEAGEFGVSQGMTVVWDNGPGKITGMSLATGKSEAEFRKLMNEHRADLELIGLYFCSHVSKNLSGRSVCWQDELLTDGEKDCLAWMVRGRSPLEISDILQVGEGEVMSRLRMAARKLRASDFAHAAAIAVELGLVDP